MASPGLTGFGGRAEPPSMSTESSFAPQPSRRDFLKGSSTILAASALGGVILPHVHAAENNTIQIALVGAGGRGTGAAANALSVPNGPTKLVAIADVFQDKLDRSYKGLKGQFGDKVDVPDDRKFVGFDAYKHAIDCLRPGDVVIFATPPAFRWVHFAYAIEKGVNVFMEKPVTVDGPSSRRMFELGEKSVAKNLKVGVGLMCRHCVVRQELFERIQDGQIGDVIALRCYRMHGPVASAFSTRRPEGMDELLWQISRFHSFLWASGGCFSDYYIHNIDESCWMKNAWPVQAQASGGRHFRTNEKGELLVDQNFDSYSVEYTFLDGTKLFAYGRTMAGCHDEFASYAHGAKGLAVISANSHTPARSRIYKGHTMQNSDIVWRGPRQEPDPYQLEWNNLIDAIRNDKPHNEVKRGVEASLVASMGRMAAHTGQVITFDQILNSDHEFAPLVGEFKAGSPAPVLADPNGKYPVPQPGLVKDREYRA